MRDPADTIFLAELEGGDGGAVVIRGDTMKAMADWPEALAESGYRLTEYRRVEPDEPCPKCGTDRREYQHGCTRVGCPQYVRSAILSSERRS